MQQNVSSDHRWQWKWQIRICRAEAYGVCQPFKKKQKTLLYSNYDAFREGNGRTQRIFIEQLCLNNGRFEIDFTEITKEEMIAASVRSANASNDMLEELIEKCLIKL